MAALTANNDTKARNTGELFADVVKGATRIWAGALVCLDATGYAIPAATALNLVVRGVAQEEANNAAGADGAINVETRRGVFRFANSAAGDLIARAEIGDDCFIVDDQTVAKTNGGGTRSTAGKIVDLDAQGVWVRVGI